MTPNTCHFQKNSVTTNYLHYCTRQYQTYTNHTQPHRRTQHDTLGMGARFGSSRATIWLERRPGRFGIGKHAAGDADDASGGDTQPDDTTHVHGSQRPQGPLMLFQIVNVSEG